MKLSTTCYLIDKNNNKILLGRKKYGIAKGILNGFGGHVEKSDSSIKDSIIREFFEETSLKLIKPILSGIMHYKYDDLENGCTNIYLCNKWKGQLKESEEMEVEWFDLNAIPFDQMWPDDKLWLPAFLDKKNIVVSSYRNKPGDFPHKTVLEFNKEIYEGIHHDPHFS